MSGLTAAAPKATAARQQESFNQQPAVKTDKNADNNSRVSPPAHNVMADILERHDRITNRVRYK